LNDGGSAVDAKLATAVHNDRPNRTKADEFDM